MTMMQSRNCRRMLQFATTRAIGVTMMGKPVLRVFGMPASTSFLRQQPQGLMPLSLSCRRRWFSNNKGDDDNESPSSAEQHALFQQQMEELKAEREALFGFTEQDQNAWSNAGSSHKHDDSFLEMIDQARREQNDVDTAGGASNDDSDATESDYTSLSTQQSQPQQSAQASKPVYDDDNDLPTLTHLTAAGKDVHMVDVGAKNVTRRVAVAESKVVFPPQVLQAFSSTTDEMVGPKGPIFATAKIAGIMAAKKTSELIPLCHPLPLDSVNLDIRLQPDGTAWIRCECRVTHKTGVEMEALTGCSVAALTIYDMTKAASHDIRIEGTRLISKSGGKRRVG